MGTTARCGSLGTHHTTATTTTTPTSTTTEHLLLPHLVSRLAVLLGPSAHLHTIQRLVRLSRSLLTTAVHRPLPTATVSPPLQKISQLSIARRARYSIKSIFEISPSNLAPSVTNTTFASANTDCNKSTLVSGVTVA